MTHAADPVQSPKSPREPAPAAADSSTAPEGESNDARMRRVEGIIRRNVYWALGVGVIPFPVVDFLGLIAVELKLIKELSDVYKVKFSESPAKSIITSLAVSVGSLGIVEFVGSSLFKMIPAVGQMVGIFGVSVVGGAFTQAVGNVFTAHFESGGTLLDFNAEKMREYFRKEFAKAKVSVAKLRKDDKAAKPAAA